MLKLGAEGNILISDCMFGSKALAKQHIKDKPILEVMSSRQILQ
jgi:hypothetical protein